MNLSEDFKAAAQTEGLYSLAYRTLFLTLRENFGISGLTIEVNGEGYSPEYAEPPTAVNPAG